MQLQHLVFSLLVLLLTDYGLAASKTLTSTKVSPTTSKPADKSTYPKKVSTFKKRPSKPSLKKVADITDKFKDLPADDLAFIKELDKQFKLHGGKVKIKVENDNANNTKNSKRTIEGELGYGYSHNGYDYNPPKYMFYPYSQNDISHNAPKYYLPDGKTEVSIEPSYSYELKPQSYVDHNEAQQIDLPHGEQEQAQHEPQIQPEQEHHAQPQQQQYEEPVIVLRIPGPAKYASHLQTLLQQYLEIRAAQYLRILEEAEHRQQHQHQHQHQHHQQLQQVEYAHGQEQEQAHQLQLQHQAQPQVAQEQHDYHQQQVQAHYEPQQQSQYPDIDHVYQHYKHRHQSSQAAQQAQRPEQHEQVYYVPAQAEEPQQHYLPQQQQQHHHQQDQPQFYYTHEQQYAQQAGPPASTYQHIYLVSMAGQAHAGYEAAHEQPESQLAQQPVYVPEPEEPQHIEEHSTPILTENNPRSSHTKVIFTHNAEHNGADYSNMYPLPSIKPNERHPAKSVPDYHQDYQEQPHPYNLQQESQETAQHYQQHEQVAPASEIAQHQTQQVVAITQRPYNYHAHGVKPRARGRGVHKRRAASGLKTADQDLQKIREFVRDNLGAQTGSEVEYKTTQVIEG